MFASKSSHKRRRSSARGDAARESASASRAIVTVADKGKGKAREEGPSWAWKRLERVVASHAINHSLQILLPTSSSEGTSELIKQLPSPPRAYLAPVPLCLFLDPVFITSHIKRGKLVALSKGSLDTDDVFCLDGNGLLHLSLTRDSYQSLGLVGQALKQSRTSSGKGRDRLSGKVERWMVRIDLLAPSFFPGKRGYDRTLARLGEWDEKRSGNGAKDRSSWQVLFCWTDGVKSSEMHFPPRHVRPESVVEIESAPSGSRLDDCWVPTQSSQWRSGWQGEGCDEGQSSWEGWKDELEAFFEWAALVSLSADCVRTFSRSDHLNSYQVGPAADSRKAAAMLKIHYRGFLPSDFCTQVLQAVQAHLAANEAEPGLDFALLSCSGFTDSPLAWRMEEAPLPSTAAPSHEESSCSSSGVEERLESGPRARKRRQKKRAQRGTISRDQVGDQVKLPGSSNCNGWQVLLFAREAEFISIENTTGCRR